MAAGSAGESVLAELVCENNYEASWLELLSLPRPVSHADPLLQRLLLVLLCERPEPQECLLGIPMRTKSQI